MNLNYLQSVSYNRAMAEEIGDWIRAKRQSMNMSIRKFGTVTGIPHTTIASIEKGMKPSVNVLKKLATYFRVEES